MVKLTQDILGEFQDFGFSIVEIGDQFTELYYGEKCIARYNQSKLTVPILHEGCRNYLKNIAQQLGGLI
jgi:hypothetical protein